jgi:hypothetical protein
MANGETRLSSSLKGQKEGTYSMMINDTISTVSFLVGEAPCMRREWGSMVRSALLSTLARNR